MKGFSVLVAIMAAALVLSSTASGSALTCAHGPNCNPGNLDGNPPSHSGGTLPHTGLDLSHVAGIAGVMLLGGVAIQFVRRRT